MKLGSSISHCTQEIEFLKMIKEPFYCIDLFAGAGGLSEGFKQEKFELTAQIEMNKWACDTLSVRLLYHELKSLNKLYYYYKYLQEKASILQLLNKFPEIEKEISNTIIQATFGEDSFDEIVARIKRNIKSKNVKKVHVILSGPPCQPYSSSDDGSFPGCLKGASFKGVEIHIAGHRTAAFVPAVPVGGVLLCEIDTSRLFT